MSLLKTIDDILDFSKVEAGMLVLESIPFSLSEVLANVASLTRQAAMDKRLEFLLACSPELPPLLVGDPLRLGQILTNLVANAIKFTDQGEVELNIACAELARGAGVKLLFSVRDTGIGLTPEECTRLFQAFSQADGSTTRRYGGTGLGLSICKRLVEAMGGEIWVKSRPGVGSVFHCGVWFGVASGEQAQHPAGEMIHDFSGVRILLVDDNEINRQITIELLGELGAVMEVAGDGCEAVEKVVTAEPPYDLVLMDIQLPKMDGHEATRLIRADDRFRRLPIIAVTAHALAEERQRALDAGMDDLITKPIDLRVMFRTIDAYLERPVTGAAVVPQHEKRRGEAVVIPPIPGLDITEALDNIDGNRELYLWVLRAFLDNQSDTADAVATALAGGDHALVQRLAHTARGVAGTIGANGLVEAASALESAVKHDEPMEMVREYLRNFTTEMTSVLANVGQALAEVAETDTGAHWPGRRGRGLKRH